VVKVDKRKQAEDTLPPELLDVFSALVDDYQDAALVHAGGLWVNYKILAALVLAGWTKSAIADEDNTTTRK
jgi:hypothetical protein